MGTVVTIEGEPIMSLEFFDLITWNAFSNTHPRARPTVARKAREKGAELAREFITQLPNWDFDFPSLTKRALIVVKVKPPREEISDIHNVCIKHITDGFTDADVFKDDEWAFVPMVIFMWAGIDDDVQYKKKRKYKGRVRRAAPMRRTIIEIHELDAVFINYDKQRLPLGRTRI